MKLLKNFSLAVITETNEKNDAFFGECLLGIKAENWLLCSLKEHFGESVSIKNLDALKKRKLLFKQEHIVCLFWDTPLVRESDLVQYCDSYLRSKKQVNLPKGFIFNRNENFTPAAYCPEPAFTELTADNLSFVYNALRLEIISSHAANGAFIYGTDGLEIDKTTQISAASHIYAPNTIKGKTRIDKGARIYANCFLEDAAVGRNCEIKHSYICGAKIGSETTVGPFAYLRPETSTGKKCKVGSFVEIKKSSLDDGVKASHLAYIGDATIGKNVNIGCGAVFVNYNGKQKFKTVVGDNAFIGSNANLVAPVEIGAYAFVAAGTTVTENVSAGDLSIGRVRPIVKEGGGIKRLT